MVFITLGRRNYQISMVLTVHRLARYTRIVLFLGICMICAGLITCGITMEPFWTLAQCCDGRRGYDVPCTKRNDDSHTNTSQRNNSVVTLFTSWRTFPERCCVYNNTLENWPSLAPFVTPILYTNDCIPAVHKQNEWSIRPLVHHTQGFPILKYLFTESKKHQQKSILYGYANGDILFTDSLLETLKVIICSHIFQNNTVLIVGRRTNVHDVDQMETSSWDNIKTVASRRGKLLNDNEGIDYFFTSAGYPWPDVPEMVVGQYHYDNWVIRHSHDLGHVVIDTTETILAVHQDAPYPDDSKRQLNKGLLDINTETEKLGVKGRTVCGQWFTTYVGSTVKLLGRSIPKYCSNK